MLRVRFMQQGQNNSEIVLGKDGTTMKCTYYNCFKSGHIPFKFNYSDCCSSGNGSRATGILQIHVGFTHSEASNIISTNWILLDTCFTEIVGNNINMVGTFCY